MKISVGTWVFLLCCLLSATGCVGNSLSERNPPYAAESGGSEGDLVLHEDNEEGESNRQNVPPHLLLGQGSNNQQQNVRNEEVASESQRNLNEVQRNRTVDRHNTSRGGNANTDDQVSAVGDSSSYDRGNDISISKNDSDADLQNGIHSHGDNNRDQSSNINFAPHAQELDPDVKITAMPAPSPEIQNRLLPREITNPANLAGHVASHNPEQFNNDTDGPENSMNTTTRQPTVTKENKYQTKGEISETTPPDKDHHQPEVTESTDFPQASLMTESITYSRTPTNENMTQHSSTPNSEMLTTTGIRSTLPTEEKDFLRTTFPQEQVHSGVFLSTILSSGRFHSTTTISNEEVKETRTLFPPSERVPEVSIRIPTEIITPEPTEPVFTTTAHVTEAPEGGSGDHERPNYPDETIAQVTLRFFTYPMEITSSTPVPVTETVNSNVKISPTQFEPVTEKKDNKVTKGGPELNTKLSSTKDNSTVTTVRSTRYGHGGDSVTESNTGSGRTFFSTASHSPEIQNVNNTPSSTQSSSSHVTVKNSFQTNSETLSTRFSESQFTGTISTNFDKSMPHSSVLTVNYPTSTTQTVATSTSGFTKGISRSLQNFTSATMESNTLGSTSGTTPNAYGTPSQRDTTINLQNITISTSRSTTPLGNATLSFTTRNSAQYNVTTGRPSVTARPTTKKPNMTTTSTTKKPTEYPKATEKPSDVYSTSPVVPPKYYICFQFLWRLNEFCLEKSIFKKDLTTIMKRKANKSFEETQIKFINELCYDKATENKTAEVDEFKDTTLKVELYFTDNQGKFDVRLTVDSSEFLRKDLTSQSRYVRKLVDVQLINLNVNDDRKDYQEKGISSGMTIAVIIVIIGGICCVCLIILQILMHKQNEKASRNILAGPNRFSLRSLDSIALNAVPKSRPHSGFWNHGLDRSEENISSLSNPLGFNSLSNMTRDMVEIYKEFEKLPNEMPSLSCVPIGAEDKNRFANVIPLSHSRVKLKKLPHEEHSEYINANFLTGYNGDVHAYIATQAPLTNTIKDFWRMVWEQQSRVIIMLMTVNETTQPRDPAYVPDTEGVNGRVKYGDIVLVLKKKEVRQEYIMSLLEVKDIENNLIREIRHFWFTSWPLESNPEPISVIKLILDTRVHYEDSGAPLVVHCSSGTGRSGTMIAIDICMRSYESKRVVDILGCVNNMRKERAGLVQNKEQYALIYKTLNEYAVIMGSPRLAPSSSSAIQLQHML